MKICCHCHKAKELKDFCKNKSSTDGFHHICKICIKTMYSQNSSVNAKLYKEKHPFRILLNSINQRCTNPKVKQYKWYGEKGIKNFLTERDLSLLWDQFQADKMKKPSIDRKDSDKDYTFENCRFIELSENTRRAQALPVLQFDLQGNFIKEWESARSAARYFKIDSTNITLVCAKRRKTSCGFNWKYKGE